MSERSTRLSSLASPASFNRASNRPYCRSLIAIVPLLKNG